MKMSAQMMKQTKTRKPCCRRQSARCRCYCRCVQFSARDYNVIRTPIATFSMPHSYSGWNFVAFCFGVDWWCLRSQTAKTVG